MGEHDVKQGEGEELRTFMRAILDDLQALEQLLDSDRIESGIRRIGAEMEMFLVDEAWRPSCKARAVLGHLEGPFTPELASFNLEANASPRVFEGHCLAKMEFELADLLGRARAASETEGVRALLCGILPTLDKSHLGLDAMYDEPRYHLLNKVMTDLAGGTFRTRIKGLDELETTHDNVLLEACNTSFQVHFQVSPHEFAPLYNLAQATLGPVMAIACNSPVLMQHRLWQETRVALFQQSLDARTESQHKRGTRQRVTFGERWVESSVLEIFREDVTRFRALLSNDTGESSLSMLERGVVPPLSALCLHNGTVYRWNRPCYGVKDGLAHLRIENRVLPAGPTVRDQVANASFYFGLMSALGNEYGDITKVLEFDHAKDNFMAAARYGLDAQFRWIGGRSTTAQHLILERLLPLAREGLSNSGIDVSDSDLYLGIIEDRVRSGRTGARWALDSLASMDKGMTPDAKHRSLTAAMYARQTTLLPVHTWSLASADDTNDWRHNFRTVGQIMTRDVFAVHPEDVIDLAASMMDWEHVHRVPVEDQEGRLVGLLAQRTMLRLLAQGRLATGKEPVAVKDVMKTELVTIGPEATTLDAINKMRTHRVGCLPVVEDGRLVGMLTEHDFMGAAARLLEESLSETLEGGAA